MVAATASRWCSQPRWGEGARGKWRREFAEDFGGGVGVEAVPRGLLASIGFPSGIAEVVGSVLEDDAAALARGGRREFAFAGGGGFGRRG